MATVNPNQYLRDAECIYNENEVAIAIAAVAKALNADFIDEQPIVLSVMNGAIYFAGHLLSSLTFPLTHDYVHATRYRQDVQGKEIEWLVAPKTSIKNKSVLIVDDILDEGVTLKAIVDKCYAVGAKEVKTAVLVEKTLTKAKAITADYVGLNVPDRYVFGCGMDVYGWWRNLPQIYALKST
jgi:hypoxanthine phosphoribosyltransferase